MKLSKNFTLEELIHSSTANAKGIRNYPSPMEIENLRRLCVEVLQPIRDRYGKPIYINSGYRNPQLNRLVGGSQSSQHCRGQAADIDTNNNKELWELIVSMIRSGEIVVSQLIDERNLAWIHVALYTGNKKNQILKL